LLLWEDSTIFTPAGPVFLCHTLMQDKLPVDSYYIMFQRSIGKRYTVLKLKQERHNRIMDHGGQNHICTNIQI